ncbi:helix-turn-helix transcriptional regulator [Kytococcus sedentarius]|uniref:Transcriptional regulator, ArsR family n=1 Tax=Kytococcus sedentarius (strain ATCC 14392 / DSM 20547 / JCM 11482 / CCUG 33030 / NBRC 15357 / NCTC 11040 / CCM 314 / 541) TaxID=478801 RepID=C7NL58_KYTSD|nr:metalloregulator ArsR/SmtB family transcription factor [Kytococcus sedentarius]ACV05600.1 transcriptional regulator, ArsR family [Kytococcus sedentarius DSM 20547]QQB64025.1 helix-turn-helix transcriptional regulator [Kytococcus sedentarius]STX12985.1 Biofilm growth-associated repressor [Kytococcus sedentarius]
MTPDDHADSKHPATADLSLTRVLSALSDPLRLGIVCLLSDGHERQWGELDAPVSKSTLSHHMKTLRSAGITRTRDEGTRCYVHLRADDLEARFPGLVSSLLSAAPGEATKVGLK